MRDRYITCYVFEISIKKNLITENFFIYSHFRAISPFFGPISKMFT